MLAWLQTAAGSSVRVLATCTVDGAAPAPPPVDPGVVAACGCAVLQVPPLRERREDIPALVLALLRQAKKLPTDASVGSVITPEAVRLLIAFPYLQGNIKELAQVVRQALVLAGDGPVSVEHLRFGRYRRRNGRPTVGLALGGGVVRGAAHVGVIKVLAENGIPVDCIAGTSVGALVGGLYAAGLSPAELERLALRMGWWHLVRPILPVAALLENRPTVRFVEQQIGPRTFADLRIPFAAVAADFQTAAPVILRTGRLGQAIQASTAIPGLVRPVRRGEQWLVDGFLVSAVPVLVARSLGADLVIAVDLGIPTPAAGQPGSLGPALLRALDIMSRRQVEPELDWADVVVSVAEPAANAYSFRSVQRFLRAGTAAATEMLTAIRRRQADLAAEPG